MDKNFIKSSFKVLVNYGISLIVFGVFLYVFLSITKDNFSDWLPVYSLFIFLLMFLIVYFDMKKLAEKEKRPQYDLNPYPLKGFLYGLLGFSPIILIEIVFLLIKFSDPVMDRIKELGVKTLLGPVYFVIRFAGGGVPGYFLASVLVPVIAMLGYLAGYYGFETKKLGIGKAKLEQEKPKFEKSPWNPTVNSQRAKAKKKKKKKIQ
jgi:amino acid transporter